MIQLAQLFQDMESLVVQQEAAVEQIDQKAENVNGDVQKANVEIDGAIQKARSRNRKKWWCLLICSKSDRGLASRRSWDTVMTILILFLQFSSLSLLSLLQSLLWRSTSRNKHIILVWMATTHFIVSTHRHLVHAV